MKVSGCAYTKIKRDVIVAYRLHDIERDGLQISGMLDDRLEC